MADINHNLLSDLQAELSATCAATALPPKTIALVAERLLQFAACQQASIDEIAAHATHHNRGLNRRTISLEGGRMGVRPGG